MNSKHEQKSVNTTDTEMEIESELNESSKNSIDYFFNHENHAKKAKLENDSFQNIDISFGDNYSTANSNVDVDKKVQHENLEKIKEEYQNLFLLLPFELQAILLSGGSIIKHKNQANYGSCSL